MYTIHVDKKILTMRTEENKKKLVVFHNYLVRN